MKKSYLFLAAVSALALTACQSDDSLLAEQPQAAVEQTGVGFDVYMANATNQTRAGRTNIMTTTTLQKSGFGIFGYQSSVDDAATFDVAGYTPGDKPDFMWNQQVNFNSTGSGWYYAPLKYWPNETKFDSQTLPTAAAGMPDQTDKNHLDRLTFFAYAPWVQAATADGATSVINSDIEAPAAVGITRITANNGVLASNNSGQDAQIRYFCATDPNQSVDLLWGVAPAGGLSYTNVADEVTTIAEGMPLIDLVKPAVNTNMKFMFQHALARLGVKVVLAADQVAVGGVFDYGHTKVTIEKIEINGNFGTNGILDLNNTATGANVANWIKKNKADGSNASNAVLTIDATHGLAAHLRYDASKNTSSSHTQQEVTGVTTTLADAIQVSSTYDSNYPEEYGATATTPAYSATTPYFSDGANAKTPTYAAYTAQSGHYSASNDSLYFYQFKSDNAYTNNMAYKKFAPSLTYPNATVFENVYSLKSDALVAVTSDNKSTYKSYSAYRKVGDTYTPTGRVPEVGDYVMTATPQAVTIGKTAANFYLANPNYFMVIPTNSDVDADKTLKVKITYYVSTIDDNLEDRIVYTKNEVEKDIVLPHLKNGVAYNLKLILGLTSVKVEAEVADWVTTGAEVNLPQNTAE